MRGKVFSIAIIRIKTRITPAYAGKRRPCGDLAAHCRDHPRLCGEKCCCMWCCKSGIGSPPPMRGKVAAVQKRVNQLRITPAYAGKSLSKLKGSLKRGDHPRLCGEKWFCCHMTLCFLGSPPPMRGKVFKSCCIILCSRITPAYAGKSRKWTEIQLHTWDHPRLCGEK